MRDSQLAILALLTMASLGATLVACFFLPDNDKLFALGSELTTGFAFALARHMNGATTVNPNANTIKTEVIAEKAEK